MSTLCVSCNEPLTIQIENDPDSDDGMTTSTTVPDDVTLACGDHFHWQCLIDSSYEIAKCPSCESNISTASGASQSSPQVLVTLNNEGGLQQNLDLFPILQEESYQRAFPEERRARAFLEFCREGDHRAAVAVLQSTDEEDDEKIGDVDGRDAVEEEAPKPDLEPAAILRYQDPLASEQTALHAAAANGHREIAWLLLLLASDYPESDIPALVYQEAASLGIMREEQAGLADIRSLRDAQGRTAEDIAKQSDDVIWNGWFGNGRLSMP